MSQHFYSHHRNGAYGCATRLGPGMTVHTKAPAQNRYAQKCFNADGSTARPNTLRENPHRNSKVSHRIQKRATGLPTRMGALAKAAAPRPRKTSRPCLLLRERKKCTAVT